MDADADFCHSQKLSTKINFFMKIFISKHLSSEKVGYFTTELCDQNLANYQWGKVRGVSEMSHFFSSHMCMLTNNINKICNFWLRKQPQ